MRPLATNRKARFEYEILEELEFGVALQGTEVKSLRTGQCSIAEAYAFFRRGELYLMNATIAEYGHGNIHNHPPTRERKLLAHRRELAAWEQRVRERGVTIVPLSLYFKGSKVKLKLGLAKGKKQYDKRQTERERSDERDMRRALSHRQGQRRG